MVSPNAWWPVPLLHRHLHSLKLQCQDMLCLPSRTPSLGWVPFADQGCTIVFTATTVTVYHPDGHPVLAGWHKQTGPRLWHFPLTKQGTTPPAAASITTLLETILPPAHPHPSQRILATSSAGVACAVYYVYEAAQAIALASRATGTAFNP